MKEKIFDINAPKKECTDRKCPFHSDLPVQSERMTGTVIKKDIHHSATIEWLRTRYVKKYERFELRRSRLRVHNPPCLDANIGQQVLVARTRPLSKTKHHTIIMIIEGKQ